MVTEYVPDRGELVWLEFDPQLGREQAKRRPALVLSPASYNRLSRQALVCPITSQTKGYPFEVPLPGRLNTRGVVLADQVRRVDWTTRKAKRIERVPRSVIDAALERIGALLGL